MPEQGFAYLRGLPRVYWLLWTGALINRLGGFVAPFLALYLTQDRQLAVEQAGLVVSVFGGGILLAGPVGGVLTDRLGRRHTMVLGLVLGALAMLHLGAARSVTHIAIAAFLLGLLGELYRPAVSAAVADLVPSQDRARAYGLLYWAINLGFAFAGALGGVISTKGFTLLFLADAATTLLYAGVIYRYVPETRPAPTPGAAPLHWTAPFRDSTFMAFAALTLLVALIFQQHIVALPLDLRAHGISPSVYGGLISINGALIVVLQPAVGKLSLRFSRSRTLAVAALITGLGFGLTGLARTPLGYGVSVAVWTLGEIIMAGISPSVVADLAPPELRGGYQGLFNMTWGGAACIAPLLGSFVLVRFGAGALWSSCVGVGVVSAIGHLLLAGPQARRLAAIAQGG